MATPLWNNAHIHYRPLTFVYLIWIIASTKAYRALVVYVQHPERLEGNWNESQMCPTKVTPPLFTISGLLPAALMTPPGLTIIIFHIMLLSVTSLPYQSNSHSIAKLCESNFSLSPSFPQWLCHFFPPLALPYCHCSCSFVSSLSCLSRAALIKHGVGGGTEASSRAEEKGSNSTSQDGAVTHNGPAILSAPHRLPTESPLLRQPFNRPPLTQHTCMSTHKHTCTYATHRLLVRACVYVTCAAAHTALGLLKCSYGQTTAFLLSASCRGAAAMLRLLLVPATIIKSCTQGLTAGI